MGLLDQFRMNDEQNQGLLAAAAQVLQGAGDPTRPFGMGQALGVGISAFQGATEQAKRRKLQEDEAKQMRLLTGLKIRDAESDFKNQETAREEAERLRNFYVNYGKGGAAPVTPMPGGQPASGVFGSLMESGGALPQSAPPAQAAPGPSTKPNPFQQHMEMAQALRQAGHHVQADAHEAAALKFKPKYSTTPQRMVGPDGKLGNYQLSEDGSDPVNVGLGVAPDIKEVRLGNRVQMVDFNTAQDGAKFDIGIDPGTIYSGGITKRGQDLVSDRAREANVIAARNGSITGATGLRKEFDDLPEVKSYKKALPAFNAIKDAATRNTTQSDINIVYGLAKLYDPDSVVREGEYATVAKSPNIPEKVKGWAQYLSGGGRLTPTVKAEILAEAQGRIGSYESEYTKARTGFGNVATRTGMDPDLVLPTEFKPAARANIPAKAVSMLKMSPKLREQFDEKYGAGAAASVLGK